MTITNSTKSRIGLVVAVGLVAGLGAGVGPLNRLFTKQTEDARGLVNKVLEMAQGPDNIFSWEERSAFLDYFGVKPNDPTAPTYIEVDNNISSGIYFEIVNGTNGQAVYEKALRDYLDQNYSHE
jgi:hypothetical protein